MFGPDITAYSFFGQNDRTDARFSQQFQLATTQPNPVPGMVRDPKELQTLFDYLGIVPPWMDGDFYAFNMMRYFQRLGENSESHSSAIKGIAKAAFGDRAMIGVSNYAGFGDEVREATLQEVAATGQWLADLGITATEVADMNAMLWRSIKESGNAYLRLRIANVNGVQRAHMTLLPYTNCAYSRDIFYGGQPMLYYSDIWTISYWTLNPPSLYAVSRGDVVNFQEYADGTLETVFHFTEKTPKTDWYGAPDTLGATAWMFYETQQSDALTRQAANRWLGTMLFVIEGPDPMSVAEMTDDELRNAVARIQNNITNALTMQGQNRAGIGVVQYPNGTQPPQAIRLEPMLDHAYIKETGLMAREKIYGAHGYTPVLNGEVQARTTLGGNMLIDQLRVTDVLTVQPAQSKMQRIWQDIFDALAVATNRPDMANKTLFFRSPVQTLIEQILPQQTNAPANVAFIE
jgi:hypothetical protein